MAKSYRGKNQCRTSACEGKEPLTWALAVEILGRFREQKKGRKRTAYHCPWCRAWHIGGQAKKKIRRVE